AKGIEVTDIAKRLMDYGFHAPTVSFPVAGTLMIEPTESEDLAELDRFCDAMLSIRKEIEAVTAEDTNNVLKNALHTLAMLTAETWELRYSRQQAAYPSEYIEDNKFCPSVRRVDDAYGDRNLICSCAPIEAYMEAKSLFVKQKNAQLKSLGVFWFYLLTKFITTIYHIFVSIQIKS